MTLDQPVRPNAPHVVAEIIDGEAVIMHLGSGHYFSAQGTGAELWALIEQGATERGMTEFLRARYGLEDGRARAGVAAFMASLQQHDLVRSGGDPAPAPAPVSVAGVAYTEPSLSVFSDMQNLLLLDPIHDVSEAGWPMPKPAE